MRDRVHETGAWRMLPWLGAVLVFVGLSITAIAVDRAVAESRTDRLRDDVAQRLTGIGNRLGSTLNANLLLANGLAAYVSANPAMTASEFRSIARNLMTHRSQIRNITVARETTMIYVFPEAGNDAVVGVDYQTLPEQWEVVRRAIQTRRTVVAGPLDLVQGGRAFVGRTPIFIEGRHSGLPPSSGPQYWGLISIPIDTDALFAKAGLAGPQPLEIALRGRDGLGAEGAVFEGDAALFEADPVIVDIPVPGGTWQIAGTPIGGWPGPDTHQWTMRGGLLFVVLVATGIAYGVAASIVARWRQRRRLERLRPGTDPATRLPTFAALDAQLQREVDLARRYGRPLALLALRVEVLPTPVSGSGGRVVDRLRSEVADAVRQALRPTDLLADRGDGVLIAVLIGANRDGAVMAANRVRRFVKAVVLNVDGQEVRCGLAIAGATLRDADVDGGGFTSRALDGLARAAVDQNLVAA